MPGIWFWLMMKVIAIIGIILAIIGFIFPATSALGVAFPFLLISTVAFLFHGL